MLFSKKLVLWITLFLLPLKLLCMQEAKSPKMFDDSGSNYLQSLIKAMDKTNLSESLDALDAAKPTKIPTAKINISKGDSKNFPKTYREQRNFKDKLDSYIKDSASEASATDLKRLSDFLTSIQFKSAFAIKTAYGNPFFTPFKEASQKLAALAKNIEAKQPSKETGEKLREGEEKLQETTEAFKKQEAELASLIEDQKAQTVALSQKVAELEAAQTQAAAEKVQTAIAQTQETKPGFFASIFSSKATPVDEVKEKAKSAIESQIPASDLKANKAAINAAVKTTAGGNSIPATAVDAIVKAATVQAKAVVTKLAVEDAQAAVTKAADDPDKLEKASAGLKDAVTKQEEVNIKQDGAQAQLASASASVQTAGISGTPAEAEIDLIAVNATNQGTEKLLDKAQAATENLAAEAKAVNDVNNIDTLKALVHSYADKLKAEIATLEQIIAQQKEFNAFKNDTKEAFNKIPQKYPTLSMTIEKFTIVEKIVDATVITTATTKLAEIKNAANSTDLSVVKTQFNAIIKLYTETTKNIGDGILNYIDKNTNHEKTTLNVLPDEAVAGINRLIKKVQTTSLDPAKIRDIPVEKEWTGDLFDKHTDTILKNCADYITALSEAQTTFQNAIKGTMSTFWEAIEALMPFLDEKNEAYLKDETLRRVFSNKNFAGGESATYVEKYDKILSLKLHQVLTSFLSYLLGARDIEQAKPETSAVDTALVELTPKLLTINTILTSYPLAGTKVGTAATLEGEKGVAVKGFMEGISGIYYRERCLNLQKKLVQDRVKEEDIKGAADSAALDKIRKSIELSTKLSYIAQAYAWFAIASKIEEKARLSQKTEIKGFNNAIGKANEILTKNSTAINKNFKQFGAVNVGKIEDNAFDAYSKAVNVLAPDIIGVGNSPAAESIVGIAKATYEALKGKFDEKTLEEWVAEGKKAAASEERNATLAQKATEKISNLKALSDEGDMKTALTEILTAINGIDPLAEEQAKTFAKSLNAAIGDKTITLDAEDWNKITTAKEALATKLYQGSNVSKLGHLTTILPASGAKHEDKPTGEKFAAAETAVKAIVTTDSDQFKSSFTAALVKLMEIDGTFDQKTMSTLLETKAKAATEAGKSMSPDWNKLKFKEADVKNKLGITDENELDYANLVGAL